MFLQNNNANLLANVNVFRLSPPLVFLWIWLFALLFQLPYCWFAASFLMVLYRLLVLWSFCEECWLPGLFHTREFTPRIVLISCQNLNRAVLSLNNNDLSLELFSFVMLIINIKIKIVSWIQSDWVRTSTGAKYLKLVNKNAYGLLS